MALKWVKIGNLKGPMGPAGDAASLGRFEALEAAIAKALADAKAYADAALAKAVPAKCVRREGSAWVWDRTAGTHHLVPDHTGALIVRPTPVPTPDATPSLTW